MPWRATSGARRCRRVDSIDISLDAGVEGDHKGVKYQAPRGHDTRARGLGGGARRLGGEAGALDWTARRANLLVEGVRLPRAIGATLRIGPVLLEVTYPTTPCARMDEARAGLRKALHPEWRGGVTCKVLEGGRVATRR